MIINSNIDLSQYSEFSLNQLGITLFEGSYNFTLKIKATTAGNKSISKTMSIIMFTPDSAFIPNFPPRLATAFEGKKIDLSRDMAE